MTESGKPDTLTEEQHAIKEAFGEFTRREVVPGADERDRTGEFPAGLVRRLGELNGMGISVPERYGGLGLDTEAQLLVIEQAAYGDAALASICTAHYLGLEVFLCHGEHSQRERFTTPLARGEALAGFALTEPEAGSDLGSMTTRATRQSNGWVLNGSKTFISNAAQADVMALFAKTEPHAGFDGITAFVVPGENIRPVLLCTPGQVRHPLRAYLRRLPRQCPAGRQRVDR